MIKDIWPVIIMYDRYGGAYSGVAWTAWNLRRFPEDLDGGDGECSEFWDTVPLCGKGSTPDEAYADLIVNVNKHEIETTE